MGMKQPAGFSITQQVESTPLTTARVEESVEISRNERMGIATAVMQAVLTSPLLANLAFEVGKDQIPALLKQYTQLGIKIVTEELGN